MCRGKPPYQSVQPLAAPGRQLRLEVAGIAPEDPPGAPLALDEFAYVRARAKPSGQLRELADRRRGSHSKAV